jgi:hypothetical protein
MYLYAGSKIPTFETWGKSPIPLEEWCKLSVRARRYGYGGGGRKELRQSFLKFFDLNGTIYVTIYITRLEILDEDVELLQNPSIRMKSICGRTYGFVRTVSFLTKTGIKQV